MRSRFEGYAAVVVGVLLGLFVASIPFTFASRNSSGTYSLPAGNPVVSGTTISTTWANNTLNDLKTEMTDSLSRSGNGAMLAQLEGYAGTPAAPGYSFDGDSDTGLYRNASNDIRMGVDSTYVQKWTSTGVTFPLGLTATQSTTNTAAIVATGNGTSNGITGTGGSTSGKGGRFTGGAPNGSGVAGDGTGSGAGGSFVGGDTNGDGVIATGQGSGNGLEATAGATGYAVTADGNFKFVSSAPASSTSFTNTITPSNFMKAWATLTSSGGTLSVANGFNITSVAATATNNFTLTLEGDMSGTDYGVWIQPLAALVIGVPSSKTTGTVVVTCYSSTSGVQANCNSTGWQVMVVGAQ